MPRKRNPIGGKGEPRPARSTHKPRKRAPKGQRQAVKLLERLDQLAFRERARLTEEQMRMLDRIASGRAVPRNAPTILRAIEFRAEYAYAKPKQVHEHDAGSRLADLLAAALGLPAADASPTGGKA